MERDFKGSATKIEKLAEKGLYQGSRMTQGKTGKPCLGLAISPETIPLGPADHVLLRGEEGLQDYVNFTNNDCLACSVGYVGLDPACAAHCMDFEDKSEMGRDQMRICIENREGKSKGT